ncbi:MAG: hypothetical protein HBSIN02_22050 [Bacteroidia bacterium]|nr:MAG: hypothetical protein HBSIN02_22050 [Bacteroidia bacterium]
MNIFSSAGSDRPIALWQWVVGVSVALVRFVHLGFPDLQAWDEALYALRAQSIVQFGVWIDQTPYAPDGLYSSLHPPLQVWLTALVFHVFGSGEAQARFISAVAGALTVPVIFALGRRMGGPIVGTIAVVLFGLNPFMVFFSRQGQFDSLLVFFLTLSVYWCIRMQTDHTVRSASIAGLALGAALMTKLFVAGALPLALVVDRLIRRQPFDRSFRHSLLTMLSVAGAVAFPWHGFMTIVHGSGNPLFFFQQSALWERTVTGIEGNVKPLGALYYINQLIVLFPIGIWWMIDRVRSGVQSAAAGVLTSWFAVYFTVFSLMQTKLAVYVLPFLVPCALLAADGLWNRASGPFKRTSWRFLLSATSLSVVWSASQDWRNALREIIAGIGSFDAVPADAWHSFFWLLALSVIAVSAALFLASFDRFRVHIVFFFGLALFFQTLFNVFIRDKTQFKDGATELGEFVRDNRVQNIVVAGKRRNPQLSYYLGGADLGWRDDLHVRRITPPRDTSAYTQWIASEMAGEQKTSLLIIEKDMLIRYRTVSPETFIPTGFRPVFESRRYAAYITDTNRYAASAW